MSINYQGTKPFFDQVRGWILSVNFERLDFEAEPSPESLQSKSWSRQKVFVCAGGLTLWNWQKHWFIVCHISIWGAWGFVRESKSNKAALATGLFRGLREGHRGFLSRTQRVLYDNKRLMAKVFFLHLCPNAPVVSVRGNYSKSIALIVNV